MTICPCDQRSVRLATSPLHLVKVMILENCPPSQRCLTSCQLQFTFISSQMDLENISSNIFSIICRYVRDFEGTLMETRRESDEASQEYIDRLVGNPVHAFKLMRRFTVDIPNIEKDLKKDDWKGLCHCFN